MSCICVSTHPCTAKVKVVSASLSHNFHHHQYHSLSHRHSRSCIITKMGLASLIFFLSSGGAPSIVLSQPFTNCDLSSYSYYSTLQTSPQQTARDDMHNLIKFISASNSATPHLPNKTYGMDYSPRTPTPLDNSSN